LKKLFGKLFIYLNYLFAGALLLSYLSTYISPAHFWPLAFFGLAFPLLLFINMIFFTVWLLKWKRVAVVSLLIIALGYNHIRDTLPVVFKNRDKTVNQTGTELKVLSYNVRVFNIYEWLSDPNTDKGIFNF